MGSKNQRVPEDTQGPVEIAMPPSKSQNQPVVLAGTALRRLWLQSIKFSDTFIARDKTARAVQYMARMLAGLTGIDVFANLLRSCAVMRKIMRFWKPVKALKRIEDATRDDSLDDMDKALTVAEVGSDGFYAFVDHFAFAQRIGLFPWMSAEQVDRLDRFIEVWWVTEIVPVIWRETRFFRRVWNAEPKDPNWQKIDALATSEKKRKATLNLFKNYIDLLCSFYFLMPAAFKNKPMPKAACGLGGVITSCISIHLNWPHEHCKED